MRYLAKICLTPYLDFKHFVIPDRGGYEFARFELFQGQPHLWAFQDCPAISLGNTVNPGVIYAKEIVFLLMWSEQELVQDDMLYRGTCEYLGQDLSLFEFCKKS